MHGGTIKDLERRLVAGESPTEGRRRGGEGVDQGFVSNKVIAQAHITHMEHCLAGSMSQRGGRKGYLGGP